MMLPALSRFQSADIVGFDESTMQLALLHLGVRVGDQIRLSHVAPLGDPLAISVNGTKIAIRKQDAAHIWVKPVH
jgi:Fe2+ transport system protein FeoA